MKPGYSYTLLSLPKPPRRVWLMVSSLSELEVLVRAIGLSYRRRENNLLLEYDDKRFGRIGLVITLIPETRSVRIAAPLDVEPLDEALSWFLRTNFESYGYKYTIDYEGFITVVYDLPARCVNTVSELRDAVLEVIEGARRVLERTETGDTREEEREAR